jgi:hypothetical protein
MARDLASGLFRAPWLPSAISSATLDASPYAASYPGDGRHRAEPTSGFFMRLSFDTAPAGWFRPLVGSACFSFRFRPARCLRRWLSTPATSKGAQYNNIVPRTIGVCSMAAYVDRIVRHAATMPRGASGDEVTRPLPRLPRTSLGAQPGNSSRHRVCSAHVPLVR